MALTAVEFIRKWQDTAFTERSACQQHFLDLCEMLAHPKPADLSNDDILEKLLALNSERA
jgi:hypothetical protein